jgi:HD-GYP domain-containing protein (c-di-GMP phosphodiesterase class II)
MPDYRLTHAVTDLTGEPLLAAGTHLGGRFMKTFVSARPSSIKPRRLLEYHRIRSDLLESIGAPPYNVILAPAARQQTLLKIAGDVFMPERILASLYHFRKLEFYTYRHTLLVFALSILIARELIDEKKTLIQEVIAGPTHDLGKLCVPREILTKKTALPTAFQPVCDFCRATGGTAVQ